MARTLDFFFYGSIHTYLSVMRIDGLAAAARMEVRWRPFNLREILIEQNNTSFVKNQIRLNYNWRDIERRAARVGIPFTGRPAYPVDPELLALRVGIVSAAERWCPEYAKATFRSWFLDGKASGVRANVEEVLSGLGKPAPEILARAATRDVDQRLKSETEAARRLGIFGSPTFVSGTEVFWGDDRLEDAMAHGSA